MGRKKKVSTEDMGENLIPEISKEDFTLSEPHVVLPLSVDYPSEGLNNMAKKINEIIEVLWPRNS